MFKYLPYFGGSVKYLLHKAFDSLLGEDKCPSMHFASTTCKGKGHEQGWPLSYNQNKFLIIVSSTIFFSLQLRLYTGAGPTDPQHVCLREMIKVTGKDSAELWANKDTLSQTDILMNVKQRRMVLDSRHTVNLIKPPCLFSAVWTAEWSEMSAVRSSCKLVTELESLKDLYY